MTWDVLIAGAGIVGAACARELSRRGLSVAIYEGACLGGGATAAGMGHIVVMDDSEAQMALTQYSRDLWTELLPQMPKAVEHEPCGTLWVAADEEEMEGARRRHEFYRSRGVDAELLDEQQLVEAEPSLRHGLAGGLRVPGDAVVYSPAAAQWMMDSAVAQGAQLHTGLMLQAIQGREVLLAGGQRVQAGCIINAAGAGANALTPGLPVRPRKGHLAITDRYPGFVRHQLVELGYLKSAHGHSRESVAFNVQPRATGQVLIGSSRQYDAEDGRVETAFLGRMLRRAMEYLPSLAQLSVLRAWTGFRAATPDSLPLIGAWPPMEGVYLATGHEGLGITTSLGTARLLADLITGSISPIPVEPYAPARFASS